MIIIYVSHCMWRVAIDITESLERSLWPLGLSSSLLFKKPEGLLLCIQPCRAESYLEADELSPHFHNLFRWSLSSWYSSSILSQVHKRLYFPSFSSAVLYEFLTCRAMYLAHLVTLNLIALLIFVEDYKIWTSSLKLSRITVTIKL